MLQPQPPSPEELSSKQLSTGTLALPAAEIRYSAIDLSVITERLKAHNEGTGLGPTLGRLIVGMVNQLEELPPSSQVPPRKLMANAIQEESSQRQTFRDQFDADMAPVLAAIGL